MGLKGGFGAAWTVKDEDAYGDIHSGTIVINGTGTCTVAWKDTTPVAGQYEIRDPLGQDTLQTFRWLTIIDIALDDPGQNGEGNIIFSCYNSAGTLNLSVRLNWRSSTTYRLYFYQGSTLLGRGQTTFTFGVKYEMRLSSDGNNTAQLEWGGGPFTSQASQALQVDIGVNPGQLNGEVEVAMRIGASTNNVNTNSDTAVISIGLVTMWHSDVESDRRDVDTTSVNGYPNETTTVAHDEWDVPAGGTEHEATDDWNGGTADDATTHIGSALADATDTTRQTMDTSKSASLSGVEFVMTFVWLRATIANKSLSGYILLSDGTNDGDETAFTQAVTTWGGRSHIAEIAPDGGAWTDAKLGTLEIGMRATATGDAVHISVSAMKWEAFAASQDSPASTGHSPEFGVVSTGSMNTSAMVA